MKMLDSDTLNKNISFLIKKVERTTGYQGIYYQIKDGGVYVFHPSGTPICYASIIQNKLEEEIYYPNQLEVNTKEELIAIYIAEQLGREGIGQLAYQQKLQEEQYTIKEKLEARKKGEEAFLKKRERSLTKGKRIERKRTIKRIQLIFGTLALIILAHEGWKKANEIITRQQQYSLIVDYIGSDTNILNQYTFRAKDNNTYYFQNTDIAEAIMETGKNPWPLLSDLMTDMGEDRESNFPAVINLLHSMDYFPYDYETLIITANACLEDGSCDYTKLAQYIRQRAVYAITTLRKETMTEQEKEELFSFLSPFSSYIGEDWQERKERSV